MLLKRLSDNEGKEIGVEKGSEVEKTQRDTPPTVVSPQPIKPHTDTSPVNKFLAAAPDIVRSQESQAATGPSPGPVPTIPSPSYRGPGATFEKGEDVPTFETPALPTEETREILDT